MSKPLGLYIHVPFCAAKCAYCDFYSVEYDKTTADLYKSAVMQSVRRYTEQERLKFDTVYFGGGTPSLLYREVAEVTSYLRRNKAITHDSEITVEANPSDISPDMLETLLKSGVNRVSIGVQSLNDSELNFLGRRHDSRTASTSVRQAAAVGFKNISVDIILGIPGQTDTLIHEVAKLPITHVSAYILKIESGTPLYRWAADNGGWTADEDGVSELYLDTVKSLNDSGFPQYEISNFAKPGFESVHNLKYWNCCEYIGVGPTAHSYYKGRRFSVSENVGDFIAAPLLEGIVTEENPGTFSEWAMLRLRLNAGVSFAECLKRGVSREVLLKRAATVPGELLRVSDVGISLTAEGFLVGNRVIGALIG